MLEKIGDLPAHPLIVHLPIVLGPVVGLLALLLLVPKWRGKLLWPSAALAVAFAISAALASQSGENFANTLQIGDDIQAHKEAAETLRLIAIVLAAALLVVAAAGSRLTGSMQSVAVVIVAALGIAAVGFTIKTGHEGAKAVWKAPFQAAEEIR